MTESPLPEIPDKRYFTIGEVAQLCAVKPYVLRYWEQEFSQLRPMKRAGNRRYYQRQDVLLIRRIRELLYDEGFTISGARNRLGTRAAAASAMAAEAGREADDRMLSEAETGGSVALAMAVVAPRPAQVPRGLAAAAARQSGKSASTQMAAEPPGVVIVATAAGASALAAEVAEGQGVADADWVRSELQAIRRLLTL